MRCVYVYIHPNTFLKRETLYIPPPSLRSSFKKEQRHSVSSSGFEWGRRPTRLPSSTVLYTLPPRHRHIFDDETFRRQSRVLLTISRNYFLSAPIFARHAVSFRCIVNVSPPSSSLLQLFLTQCSMLFLSRRLLLFVPLCTCVLEIVLYLIPLV